MVAVAGLFVQCWAAEPAAVGSAAVGPILITVPEGFQTAQTQRLKKTLITAWTKSVRRTGMKTLLQINVFEFGAPAGGPHPAAPLAEADLPRYAEKYLRQFLADLQHRRGNFVASPVAHIKLAELPAVRASWNGSVGGRPVVGVMYSVIVRNRYAVIFHTQDLGSTPTSGMFEAMSSIESVAVQPDGEPTSITTLPK